MEEDVNNHHEPTLKELSTPSDYEAFTKISAPLNKNANFKIDATMLNFLPSFNGQFSDEPYEFLREFTQFFSSYYFPGISQEVVKLMLFPFALMDRTREWLNGTGETFTPWQEVQTSFLQKYFSYGRTHALRKLIRDFMQGNETFGEAWERFMILKCPHHCNPNNKLAQIFYQGLDYQERQLVDISSGGNILNTRASESLKRMEELVEDWVFRQSSMIDTKIGGLKRGVIDVNGMEADIKMEKLEREMKQSVIDITKTFKHLFKDAIATIKPDVNLNKGNSDLTCLNCTTNDHMQDKGKVILIEQVHAFGAHSTNNNWNAGNKMTNFGNNSGQQGFGIQNNQFKMPNQQQFSLPYPQKNQPFYQNMHFQHSQLPYQHTQPQLYQNAANMQLPTQSYTNHIFNNNLWETVKCLHDKEKTW